MPRTTHSVAYPLLPISIIVGVAMLAMAGLQALPEAWRILLRYDRQAVAQGQVWRLLTAHFVHLGWSHLALNLAGLGLGTWLFGADRSPKRWLIATLVSAIVCGSGLWLLSPGVGWCVGLSGVLHGLMIVGFGSWIISGDRWAWALLGAVLLKLGWEQFGGTMPWSEAMSGGSVITDAHLWGALGGGLFLAGEALWRQWVSRV